MFEAVKGLRIAVVGDIMLDRYVFGNADRPAAEASILILRSDKEKNVIFLVEQQTLLAISFLWAPLLSWLG